VATLERRVQVLFDEELYERLQTEAQIERTSVGAFIRDAVEERLQQRRRLSPEQAMEALFRSADEHPSGAIDWVREKEELAEREFLRNIP